MTDCKNMSDEGAWKDMDKAPTDREIEVRAKERIMKSDVFKETIKHETNHSVKWNGKSWQTLPISEDEWDKDKYFEFSNDELIGWRDL